MSEITQAKATLKKIISTIEEINGLNEKSTPKLIDLPTNILQMIEAFESEKNDNVKAIESNIDEINSLKSKISSNEREIIKSNEQIEDLTENRKMLSDKIQSLEQELKKVQEKINAKSVELKQRSQRLEELEERIQKLTSIQEKQEEKINATETELQNEFNKKDNIVKTFESRIEAMKLLIKKEYIRSAQYQFIRALQQNTAIELKNIIAALDLKEAQAKKIVKEMVQANGPIEYDEDAGTVMLKGEVDF